MFNKPKTVKLFVVSSLIDEDGKVMSVDNLRFYTITETIEEAKDYVNRRLYLDNRDHFVGWCNLRNINPDDDSNWEQYLTSTNNIQFGKYLINKVTYRLKDVALIFRMFNNCIPIGASYEEEVELVNFMQTLSQDKLKELEDKIKKHDKESVDK
jgi:hypothetical protein